MQGPSHSPHEIRVSITPGTITTALLIGAAAWLLFYLWDIVLIALTAIVIASAIEPLAKRLTRIGIPRVVAVVSIYAFILGTVFSLFYLFVPPLLAQTREFLTQVPQYLDILLPVDPAAGPSGTSSFATLRQSITNYGDLFSTTAGGLTHTITAVFGGLMSFVLIVVLSFYFAIREEGIDDFLRLVTPPKHQAYALSLWKRSQHKIGRWMQGQLLLSLIVGLLVFAGLSIFGVRYALLLSIVAALLELIPVFGSIIAAVPAVIVAAIDGGSALALVTILVYVVANQLQGNIIYPLVVQKVVGVPPLLVILALLAGAKIAGFLGILLSVPLAAIVMELVYDLDKRRRLPLKEGEAGA